MTELEMLTKQAKELGIKLDANETIADLQAKIKAKGAKPRALKSAPKKPDAVTFRAHFRKSDSDGKFTMDVTASNIGEVHAAVRKAHQNDKVSVFIDKVKVLGGE